MTPTPSYSNFRLKINTSLRRLYAPNRFNALKSTSPYSRDAILLVISVCLRLLFSASSLAAEIQINWIRTNLFTTGLYVGVPAIGPSGTLYVPSHGTLMALSPDNRGLWGYSMDFPETASVAKSGRIYITSLNSGGLVVLDRDGHLLWTNKNVAGPLALGADDSAYGNIGSQLVAFDPNGNEKWRFDSGVLPAIGPQDIIYVTENGSGGASAVLAISSAGKLLFTIKTGPTPRIAIGNSGILYVTTESGVFAYYPDGKEKWHTKFPLPATGRPVLDEAENIYFFGSDTKLYALERNGYLKWVTPLEDRPLYTPVVTENGTVILATESGLLLALSSSGEILLRFRGEGKLFHGPALGPNGAIYFSVQSGDNAVNVRSKLYCLNGIVPPAKTWSSDRGNAANTARVSRNFWQSRGSSVDLNTEVGLRYSVQVSPDFKSWAELTTFVSTSDSKNFRIDREPAFRSLFYRSTVSGP